MVEPTAEASANEAHQGRWNLIRDVAVFQVKLIVDGLRDVILVPASLIAGVVSLVNGESGRPGPQFYRLLRAGKQSERWINLFAAYNRRSAAVEDDDRASNTDIDDLVARVEAYVVDEYRRGELTAQAKATIDKALDAIQRTGRQDH